MRKLNIAACLMLFWVAMVAGAPPADDAQAGARPRTIVCLGDSITRAGYPAELEKLLSVRVINAGVNGNTSRQGLARLERDVLAHRPDAVLVFFGANDSRLDAPKTHVPLAEYETNLAQIVERCQKIGAKVVLGTPPPIDAQAYYQRHPEEFYTPVGGLTPWLAKYCDAVRRVGEKMQVPVVNLNQLLAKEDGWRKPDGVHPTPEGNRIIARLFSTHLRLSGETNDR